MQMDRIIRNRFFIWIMQVHNRSVMDRTKKIYFTSAVPRSTIKMDRFGFGVRIDGSAREIKHRKENKMVRDTNKVWDSDRQRKIEKLTAVEQGICKGCKKL